MKLLFLCSRLYWEQKVPRTRFYAVEAIGQLVDLHCTGVGFNDWQDAQPIAENLARIGFRPDAILVYKPDQYVGWNDPVLPPAITTFNDAWATEDRLRDIRLPRCKLVVMHHANEMAEWQKRCPDVRFVNIPYPINPHIFKDYGIQKSIDVLLTGAVDHDIYPLRHRFARLIEQAAFRPYYAVHRKHCGYRIPDPESEAHRYARMLNTARICLADTSKHKYAAEKLHEIPACASVLCSNCPAERQDRFRSFMLEINPAWSDETVVRTITDYLKAPGQLKIMARIGHKYIHGHHTTDHYAATFIKEVECLIA